MVPVAEKYFELYLGYVNHQKENTWVGTTVIIKVMDILIYLHLTFFFNWLYSNTYNSPMDNKQDCT